MAFGLDFSQYSNAAKNLGLLPGGKKKTDTGSVDKASLFKPSAPNPNLFGSLSLSPGGTLKGGMTGSEARAEIARREAEAKNKPIVPSQAPKPSISPAASATSEVIATKGPTTPSGLTEGEALELGKTASPITQFAESKTKSSRDKLIDLLLERASKPFDIEGTFKTMREEAGIPGLESTRQKFVENITKVEGLLDKLEEDITSRLQGSLATESQRRRMLASEQKPLFEQLETAERGLRTTDSALTSKESLVTQLLGFRQDSRKEQLDSLKTAVELGDKDRASIISLAGEYPEAGISTEDSIETALQKAQPYITEERELKREKEFAEIDKIYGSIDSPQKKGLEIEKLQSEIEKNRATATAALIRASASGRGRPLPTERANFFATTSAIQSQLDQMESLINKGTGTGFLSGVTGAIGRFTGLGSADKTTFNTVAKNLQDEILRARSGAATGENEFDRMLEFLPDTFTQEGVNLSKIKELRGTLRRVVSLNAEILSQTGYNVPEIALGRPSQADLDDADFIEE